MSVGVQAKNLFGESTDEKNGTKNEDIKDNDIEVFPSENLTDIPSCKAMNLRARV